MPRHTMSVCEDHGDNTIIIYDYDGCPLCEQESRVKDLEQKVFDLETELEATEI